MTFYTFGPQSTNTTSVRPATDPVISYADTWFEDCTGVGGLNGTQVSPSWANTITAQLNVACRNSGIDPDPANDNALWQAMQAADVYVLPQATVSTLGGVELATNAEAAAFTSTTLAVTPAGVQAGIAAFGCTCPPFAGYDVIPTTMGLTATVDLSTYVARGFTGIAAELMSGAGLGTLELNGSTLNFAAAKVGTAIIGFRATNEAGQSNLGQIVFNIADSAMTVTLAPSAQTVGVFVVSLTDASSPTGAFGVPITTSASTTSVEGGTSPFTYLWSEIDGKGDVTINSPTSSSTSFSFTGPQPGVFTRQVQVLVTDATGLAVTVPETLTFTVTDLVMGVSATVPSAGNGYVDTAVYSGVSVATAAGGQAPYIYQWTIDNPDISISEAQDGSATFSIVSASVGTATGTATVVATDRVGQTATTTVPVSLTSVDPTMTLSVLTPASTTGYVDTPLTSPEAEAYVTGGIGPYTYAWTVTGGATIDDASAANPTFTLVPMTLGDFTVSATVVATDSLGQTATDTITVAFVSLDPPLSLTATTPAAVTGNVDTALITAAAVGSPSGGTAPYTYAWTVDNANVAILSPTTPATPFSFTDSAIETVTATATLTVTDHFGYTATTTVPLSFTSIDPPLSVTASTPAAVTGDVNTTLTTEEVDGLADGGTGPYTYAWTVDNAGVSIAAPAAASTTFSFTDSALETVTATATLTVTDKFGNSAAATTALSFTSVDPPLYAAATTPAAVTGYVNTTLTTAASAGSATGGTAPYTYAWSADSGVTVKSPNASSTKFTFSSASLETVNATATLTVTDKFGTTASTTVPLVFTVIDVPMTVTLAPTTQTITG